MCDFTATETHRAFHFVAVFQEFDHVTQFRLVVMFLDISAKPNFLDIDDFLILTGFFFFLLCLVTELAVVHNPAYRRFSRRRYIHQIQIQIDGHLQSFTNRLNPDLLTFCTNQTNFLRPYFIIDQMFLTDNSPPPNGLLPYYPDQNKQNKKGYRLPPASHN
ncbi:hypothetical protein D3C81_1647020 [compost metagenome]